MYFIAPLQGILVQNFVVLPVPQIRGITKLAFGDGDVILKFFAIQEFGNPSMTHPSKSPKSLHPNLL